MNKNLIICLVQNLMIILIDIYRIIFSSILGPCCRFSPSCSLYAKECLKRYGLKRGLSLTTKRLLKCHPFHPGGYDPIPVDDAYYKYTKKD